MTFTALLPESDRDNTLLAGKKEDEHFPDPACQVWPVSDGMEEGFGWQRLGRSAAAITTCAAPVSKVGWEGFKDGITALLSREFSARISASITGTDPTGLFDRNTFMTDFQQTAPDLYAFIRQQGAIFFARIHFYNYLPGPTVGSDGRLGITLDDSLSVAQAVEYIRNVVQKNKNSQYAAFLRLQNFKQEAQQFPPTAKIALPEKEAFQALLPWQLTSALEMIDTRKQWLTLILNSSYATPEDRPAKYENFEEKIHFRGDPRVKLALRLGLYMGMDPRQLTSGQKELLKSLTPDSIAKFKEDVIAYRELVEKKANSLRSLIQDPTNGTSANAAEPRSARQNVIMALIDLARGIDKDTGGNRGKAYSQFAVATGLAPAKWLLAQPLP
jgi:hypothetical protein